MSTIFKVHFDSIPGQNLFVTGSCDELGHWDKEKAIPMTYLENNEWVAEVILKSSKFEYQYFLKDERNNTITSEWSRRSYDKPSERKNIILQDNWYYPNLPEFKLNTKFFKVVGPFLTPKKTRRYKKNTHRFQISFKPSGENEALYIIGSSEVLGNWDEAKAKPMQWKADGFWSIDVNLKESTEDIHYKYIVKDTQTQALKYYETGDNRFALTVDEDTFAVYHDTHFRQPEENRWRGSGVAIPIFSLRSEESCGVGEFLDLIPLGQWASDAGFAMIQILPIHDTIATKDWTDSYPYAAISVYALHPMYLRLSALKYKLTKKEQKLINEKSKELNDLSLVDYEAVVDFKIKFLKKYFKKHKDKILKKKKFKAFLDTNKDWIQPYAVFSVLRDKYKTPVFTTWKKLAKPSSKNFTSYFSEKHKKYENVMFYVFVQWQLHEQLSQAVNELHKMKLTLKGDLPIGIYRHSVEAWWRPALFNLKQQAGAPPDDFAVLGQNWEFPTYDWDRMKANNYDWWKSRLQFMSQYFDAFRIDHILGFFRIWQIPLHATQGILGRFEPALAIDIEELKARDIQLDIERLTKPYIDIEMLNAYFGDEVDEIIAKYFNPIQETATFEFKKAFATQRKIKNALGEDHPHLAKLLEIVANVLFIKENTEEVRLHPRFFMESTISYQRLDEETQAKLKALYIDYFFHRHEDFWKASGLEKLPAILQATDMLACGEDLGLVPKVVPTVMQELAILSLEIQRMPSEDILFSHPSDAPYLSVVSPSSHDTSTLRQWWKEDCANTQIFYNDYMGMSGEAPEELTPELLENIIDQHLFSSAMLSVIPLQEFMGMSDSLRNPNDEMERINIPAVFPHYWRYRMHITLETLLAEEEYTEKLRAKHIESGRFIAQD